MTSALVPPVQGKGPGNEVVSSDLGSGPGRVHCVVFLGKTLHSHSVSLHALIWVPASFMLE